MPPAKGLDTCWPSEKLIRPSSVSLASQATGTGVTLGYKGRLLATIEIQVPYSHSAGAGTLPAEKGVQLWQQIQAYTTKIDEGRQGSFNSLDPSLRAINSQDEGAYGLVNLQLGFRLPTDIHPQTLEKDLRAVLEPELAEFDYSLTFTGHEQAHRAGKSNPLSPRLPQRHPGRRG